MGSYLKYCVPFMELPFRSKTDERARDKNGEVCTDRGAQGAVEGMGDNI